MGAANNLDPYSSLWAWLAHDLRFYRLRAGLSLPAMGEVIGRSPSSLSNCEAGRRRITAKEAKRLDDHFDTGGHFQRLVWFAMLGHDPDWFRNYVELEARATVLRIYASQLIPGLLQTGEYARVLAIEGGAEDPDALVGARLARQEILKRRPAPNVLALLDHAVIDRPVGGPRIMAAQLARLLELSESQDFIIRVVPRAVGYHRGLEGAFQVLTVDNADVSFLEAQGGGRLAMEPMEVRSFTTRYERIGADALSRQSSRCLLKSVMESFQ